MIQQIHQFGQHLAWNKFHDMLSNNSDDCGKRLMIQSLVVYK